MRRPFRDTLWQAMEPIYQAILVHPFLTGLYDGTLPRDAFARYVVQDGRYIVGYARALQLLAARAPDPADVALFGSHATNVLAGEGELHAALLGELGEDAAAVAGDGPSPTCLAYTSYLRCVAHEGSFAEGVGAVLPCYWIYHAVGRELQRRGSRDFLYQRWIDAYAGEAFAAVVEAVLQVVDRLDAELAPAERARVVDHCIVAARYEWLFWDSAHRGEAWPAFPPPAPA